jgi:hypothetical protein
LFCLILYHLKEKIQIKILLLETEIRVSSAEGRHTDDKDKFVGRQLVGSLKLYFTEDGCPKKFSSK